MIISFLHKVRPLPKERGVSTILVVGSCGDFFDEADVVVKMQDYHCHDVTSAAKQIAAEMPSAAGTSCMTTLQVVQGSQWT